MVRNGRLEVIFGPMFSRKTGSLILRLGELNASGRSTQLFVLDIAQKDPQAAVAIEHVSRAGVSAAALAVGGVGAIRTHLRPGVQAVGVDDAHFASPDLAALTDELRRAGIDVYLAGLDMDFTRKAFVDFLAIWPLSDLLNKRYAFCAVCGEPATFTARLEHGQPVEEGPRILAGGDDIYQPRCFGCFELRLRGRGGHGESQPSLNSTTSATAKVRDEQS